MPGKTPQVLEDLARYQAGAASRPISKQEAFRQCEKLAHSHYENFIVASLLIPRQLRPHLYSIYAFCRWSDDLADEIGDSRRSLELLEWWRSELHLCYQGAPRHPVYIALKETIESFQIPIEPFEDLLDAFVQDQHVTSYETYEQLRDYCRRSANPVGRLFLHLFGYTDPERLTLSDYTCTALQLANFWQDIAPDLERNRIYLPRQEMHEFGYSEDDLRAHRANEPFRRLMHFQATRTHELFQRGLGLVPLLEPRLRTHVEMFSRGGIEILRSIEVNDYDVFSRRPQLSRKRKLWMLMRLILSRRGFAYPSSHDHAMRF